MTFLVQGSGLTIIARTPKEALQLYGKLAKNDPGAFISDMNGLVLDIDRLTEGTRPVDIRQAAGGTTEDGSGTRK